MTVTPESKEILEKMRELTVLVVDDDAMVMNIIVEHLTSFGFHQILQAKDGKAALRFVQDAKQRIDLILSDWEMPQVDGHTLLKAVRQHPIKCTVKFMMVTSQASTERTKIAQAKQLNVDAYIVKPFRGELLREKILKVLGLDSGTRQAG
jgi:CheY-like chemotaxis protein